MFNTVDLLTLLFTVGRAGPGYSRDRDGGGGGGGDASIESDPMTTQTGLGRDRDGGGGDASIETDPMTTQTA